LLHALKGLYKYMLICQIRRDIISYSLFPNSAFALFLDRSRAFTIILPCPQQLAHIPTNRLCLLLHLLFPSRSSAHPRLGGSRGTYPPVACGVLRDLPKWEGSRSVDGCDSFPSQICATQLSENAARTHRSAGCWVSNRSMFFLRQAIHLLSCSERPSPVIIIRKAIVCLPLSHIGLGSTKRPRESDQQLQEQANS
jgi:hypothetical protein